MPPLGVSAALAISKCCLVTRPHISAGGDRSRETPPDRSLACGHVCMCAGGMYVNEKRVLGSVAYEEENVLAIIIAPYFPVNSTFCFLERDGCINMLYDVKLYLLLHLFSGKLHFLLFRASY